MKSLSIEGSPGVLHNINTNHFLYVVSTMAKVFLFVFVQKFVQEVLSWPHFRWSPSERRSGERA